MTSRLFQRLAKLPGVNLFNWKEKTAHFEPATPREEPKREMTDGKLYFLGIKYFSKVIVQDKYIRLLENLASQYELEVEKLDIMQARHEREMDQIKAECQSRISDMEKVLDDSDTGKLLKRIKNLEIKNKELQANANKNLLTDEKMTEFLEVIQRITAKIDKPGSLKHIGRVKDLADRLTVVLNRFMKASN